MAFHCSLCNKGYARMNEYEAHLSSYDHSHKQRLKDMKAMVRDPAAVERARKAEAKAEAKADGIVKVMPTSEGAAAVKKGGFKKSGFKSAFTKIEGASKAPKAAGVDGRPSLVSAGGPLESDTEDEGYQVYDPRYPTD
jgi:Zinc-finger double-stranded RNA-binding